MIELDMSIVTAWFSVSLAVWLIALGTAKTWHGFKSIVS